MTLSAAIEEACAASDVSGHLRDTLEFDHPSFAEPLRFVQGNRIPGVYETEVFPVAGNPTAVFTVVDFSFVRPGQGDGGPTRAKICVDNVSRLLQQALRSAISSSEAFSVVYRCYSTNDVNHPEVFDGLKLGSVSVSALSATGDLYYEEVEMQAFPRQTYSLPLYPALYGQ